MNPGASCCESSQLFFFLFLWRLLSFINLNFESRECVLWVWPFSYQPSWHIGNLSSHPQIALLAQWETLSDAIQPSTSVGLGHSLLLACATSVYNDKLSIYTFLLYLFAVTKSKPLKTGKFVGDRGNNYYLLYFNLRKVNRPKKKTQLDDISNRVSDKPLFVDLCVLMDATWLCRPGGFAKAKPSGRTERSASSHRECLAFLLYQNAASNNPSSSSCCCQEQQLRAAEFGSDADHVDLKPPSALL